MWVIIIVYFVLIKQQRNNNIQIVFLIAIKIKKYSSFCISKVWIELKIISSVSYKMRY